MASCAYCSTFILFGGKKQDDLTFCNAKCEAAGSLARVANQLPAGDVAHHVAQLHAGSCPKCGGDGPVDVHTTFRVWSALVMTQYMKRPSVSCKSCANKQRLGDTAISTLFGWWGFPWGILVTPVYIVRNLAGFFGGPDPREPSPALEKAVRYQLAATLAGQTLPEARR